MKAISHLLAMTMLAATFISLIPESAHAKPVFLLSNSCVRSGGGFHRDNTEVSIGRELFTSIMKTQIWIGSDNGATLTCRLRTPGSKFKFKTLKLSFGIPDQVRSSESTLIVYADGNQVASKSVSSGDKEYLAIDVSKVTSIALEVKCFGSDRCTNLYFPEAILETFSTPGGRNQL
jgi:hypothetical protein